MEKKKFYKNSLRLQFSKTTELFQAHEQSKKVIKNQQHFIDTVLQLCKVTSCSQAVDKLVQTRAKSNFVDRVTDLFQHSTGSKTTQLKSVWRWVKYLPGQVV